MLQSYKKYVNRFIVPSRFYLAKFAEWGFDPGRFSYIPNFINVHEFTPQYRPGNKFIYFGRLSKEKGLLTLFKAAAGAGASLLIAGTGPMEPYLRKFASENNLDAKFLGYLTGLELHQAIASARAVILPSEWYENAPLSLLEAYTLGKPAIGANIGGIPELITDGETGIVFQSGSAEKLAEALVSMTNKKDHEIEKMGKAARQFVAVNFSKRNYLEKIIDLYESLIN